MTGEHRTVVLTGTTRGLGREMARRFREKGLTVTGCGRDAQRISKMNEEFGTPHGFSVVDIASDEDVADWAQRTLDSCGPPDLLINNAALINVNAPLWLVPAKEFSDVVDVNIKGMASVIRHFLPAMLEREQGVVVNFSSGWGRSVSPEVAPYCATKWAVEGLTRALAEEMPAGMAAVPLNPGIINTDMLQSCFGSSASSFPQAEQWSRQAVPFILSLGPKENGQPVSVPGV